MQFKPVLFESELYRTFLLVKEIWLIHVEGAVQSFLEQGVLWGNTAYPSCPLDIDIRGPRGSLNSAFRNSAYIRLKICPRDLWVK